VAAHAGLGDVDGENRRQGTVARFWPRMSRAGKGTRLMQTADNNTRLERD
jgi:hypothetical protein